MFGTGDPLQVGFLLAYAAQLATRADIETLYDMATVNGARLMRLPDYGLETIAAREVFEETGLLVEIGDFLVDCERDLSVARYFLARRIAGTPSGMGWEAQAVWLVPMAQLQTYAPHRNDAPIVQAALETSRSPLVG